ncbi:unnamed protein product [Allacma fusca]|uniref:Uncharacterized protein n=1 Tax=Allacma fusca TaxID=39272 RepID=A0A8J2PJV0_9HEXA|nr:unnamed protein product [Allacma fusca]
MRNHGHWNSEGSYFLMKFDSPPRAIGELQEEYDRDVDIVRTGFSKIFSHPEYDCTLEDELQPPAYREEVKQMLTTGRKKERKFEYKTGLPYNPFRF